MYDAAIIGGGPAGSTVGRLLAAWGHSVIILAAPPSSRPGLAECLPPSTGKLFDFLGIRQAIDTAAFLRTTGNTVWWGSKRRVENYPEREGYQVPRADLDAVLLYLASEARAQVEPGKAFNASSRLEFQSGARRRTIRARFILDCSGRAGVFARAFRLKETKSRTIALCGVWRNETGWRIPDPTHTLIEAYADGWAWSVPISAGVRHVAFMVDPGETKMLRGAGLAAAYQAELAKTRAFRRIFSRGKIDREPWGRDASLYSSRRYAGPGLLLVGDAASFIDPLSSFGVKKAMASAWVAAVAVNTCLVQPDLQAAALQFFNDRESRVYSHYRHQASNWFRAAGSNAETFWTHRSVIEEPESIEHVDIRQAFEALKRKSRIDLRVADGIRLEPSPVIEGRLITLRDALVTPDSSERFDFFQNVDLPRLARLASSYKQVPDLFGAYNRTNTPVSLPSFLSALSMLIARRILIDQL